MKTAAHGPASAEMCTVIRRFYASLHGFPRGFFMLGTFSEQVLAMVGRIQATVFGLSRLRGARASPFRLASGASD